jgi:hypothetical protein
LFALWYAARFASWFVLVFVAARVETSAQARFHRLIRRIGRSDIYLSTPFPPRSALAGACLRSGESMSLAAPVRRLGPTAVEILESLYQHRLLSTAQVHGLHTPLASLRWCQRLLADLERADLAESARRPGGGKLHFLTSRGIDAVETIPSREELRRKLVRPEHAAGPLQQHTLAVNDVGLAFVRSARERGEECPPLAWRHEVAHAIGGAARGRNGELLVADAVLTYTAVSEDGTISVHYRFIELDRGTMTTDALAQKLGRYARLRDYKGAKSGFSDKPLWHRHYPVFPSVMIVLAHRPRRQLERRAHVALALARANDRDQRSLTGIVTCCLLEDLVARGPEAPIFIPIEDANRRVSWRQDYDAERPDK